MTDPKFDVSLVFSSAASFRNAVRTQSILQRRPVKQLRNFGRRVKFVCGGNGCKWCIYASPMPRSSFYQVKTYQRNHTCFETFKQANITARWIAQYYENDIRMNPTWHIPALQKKVVNDWRCDVSVHVVGRAKRMALGHIKGDHKLQYGLFWDYINQLKKVMPESTVEMVLEDAAPEEESRRFKRIYICLGPIKRGFKAGCRPIIGLDGCHLKGPYGGQLLAAVGTYSNDGMYPIAWAVVEAENTDAWNWFLTLLAADVDIQNSGAWTFISDRQKGLINALMNVVPNVEHKLCVMHIYNNMKKVHKGRGLMSLLWLATKATTEYSFNKHMDALKKLSKKAYDWLMEKPRSQWTRSAFPNTCMSDMFVKNHCEVFNNSIANFRDLPIIGLLQGIHKAVMKRIQVRRDKMLHTYQLNPICPNVMRKFSKAVKYSGGVMVQWSGASKYLCTMTDGGHEIVVDLDNKTCACRKYDRTGLPCYHACACIKWKNLSLVNYIHKTYEKDMFLKTYACTVEPINNEQYWDNMPFPGPLHPQIKIQPGRPKKKRNKKNDVVPGDMVPEQTKLKRQHTTIVCSYCGETKHNARTCPAKKHDKIVEGGEDHANVGSTTGDKTKKKAMSKNKSMPKKKKKSVKVVIDVINVHGSANEVPFIPTAATLPTVGTGHSQGGIFTPTNEHAFLDNVPLGIQPCQGIVVVNGSLGVGVISLAVPLHAQLWGIYYGLKHAWEHNITIVILECDSAEAVALVLENDPNYPMAFLLELINNLMEEDWDDVQLEEISEGANQAALLL
ncbi:uncharacterized protein LOC141680252 [Apium graveolens]|uniref:uncharacterized protein LOC141680252 n=1 Tax=Apium graveolens TaxID=4045 RepID=UPI003D7A2E77